MPLYGSIDGAKALLRANPDSVFNTDADARLVALQKAVSALIEHETGRSFGTGETAETVAIDAPGVSDVLVLPKGVRTIASVTVAPTWDGSAWTGGTVLEPDAYRPHWRGETGEYLGLVLTGGWWSGTVVVAGTWADTDADATVPDDITYVANYLMAERFKVEMASPAGQIGPDGSVLPIRNALKDPLVRAVLDHWRAAPALVV